MMCYSIECRDKIFVKGYEFFSFTKNMGKNGKNECKNLSSKYCQNPRDHAKQPTRDALKTVCKRAIQKTAENEIADKLTKN